MVDASEATVKCGGTHPTDLLRLQRRGVRVFSVQNLHAKMYVFGKTAFIGSANASHNSKSLKEAIVRTTDPKATAAARVFVESLCLQELGPEALRRLQTLYKPPKFPMGGFKRTDAGSPRAVVAALRLVSLWHRNPPEGSEGTEKEGRAAAQSMRKHPKSHDLDEFHWPTESFHKGESIIQVTTDGDGRVMISAPGEVLSTRTWSNGRAHCTFVYLEIPRRNRVSLGRLAKKLGRGSKKRLQRSGRVNRDLAERLRKAWR